MQAVGRDPGRFERVDVLRLTQIRQDVLNRHGFTDPFRSTKRVENERALAALPAALADLDSAPGPHRWEALAQNLLAGNLFDLGSRPTVELYRRGALDLSAAHANLPPRPWRIDDLEAWRRRQAVGPPYRHALVFVDNAGPDIVLGCLPLARELLKAGTRVTLAANSEPALNDVTAAEAGEILRRAATLDALLADAVNTGRLRVVESGSRIPLLDLTRLSAACVETASDAELIWLHGMGRAIEGNFDARFTCDALRTAVIKDPAVAQHVGSRLFDCVFRFDTAPG